MAVFTSSYFMSAAASGKDWREVSKNLLEQLESAKNAGHAFNVGFLYISDHLADDASSVLNLFRSVLNIENWVGTVGLGVCGIDGAHIDKPAIAAMIANFAPEDFCVFPGPDADHDNTKPMLEKFQATRPTMLVFTHGDPLAEEDPARTIKTLEQITNGFVMGGLSSSRNQHVQFAGNLFNGGVSGIAFSQEIAVASTLSQGCIPIGAVHTITRADDHFIRELDGRSAGEVFEDDLRAMAAKIGHKPGLKGGSGENYKTLIKGEVHAAFPVSESDQNDYLVRNIIGIDPETGTMALAQSVTMGERVMFVRRDEKTVYEDLSASLIALRKRIQKNTGSFEPRGALYVSCVARAFSTFDNKPTPGELDLIREVIGDVPLAGFYAGGEISAARLYGYTGILTLFL